MIAQAKSKIIMCSVHDEKKMTYVCSTCPDILICSRCKNTEHHSHKLMDIKTVAQEKLYEYRKADNSVKTQFTAMLKTLKNLRSYKAYMEQSIENANTDVDEIIRYLKYELKTSAGFQKKSVETFASKSSDSKLEGEIRDVEDLLPELRRSHRELIHVLGKGISHQEICHKVSLIEESKRICEKAAKIMQQAANRSSTIYLPVQSKVDAVSKVMRDVLKQSQPVVVQTVDSQCQHSYATDLAFVHMIEIAEASPETIICALHIAEDDCIVAVYGKRQLDAPSNKGERKDTAMFGVFGANGLQKLSKTIELRDERNPVIYTSSNKRVTVFCPKSETRVDVLDLGTFFDDNSLNKKSSYYFKKENKVSLVSKSYKIYRVGTSTESSDEHVLTVSIDSPQQVAGDQAGNTFAIIHRTVVKENKTQKTLKVVQVFSKPQHGSAANSIGMIGNNMDRFEPVDLCFYQKDPSDEPVLLVATCDNILVVNLKDLSPKDCFSLGYWLPNREPLLPTAMTTDRKGQLWVGCKGGKVLCWMPLEVVTNQLYSLPVEEEAGIDDEEAESDWPDDEFHDDDDDDESHRSSERASSVTTTDPDTASTDCSSDSQSREYKNEFPQSFNEELKAKTEFWKKRISGGNMSDSQQKKSVSDSVSTASTEQLAQGEDKPLYLEPIVPSMPGQLQPLPDPLPPCPPVIVSALGTDQQQQEQEETDSPPPKPPRRVVSEHFPPIPPVKLQRGLSQPPASQTHVDATYFHPVVSPTPSAATLQVTHSRQQQQHQQQQLHQLQQQQQQHQQQQQQTPINKASEIVQHKAPDATSGTTRQPQQQQMPQHTSWSKEQQNEQAPGTKEPGKSQPQHGPKKILPKIAPKPHKCNLPAGASPHNVTPSGDGDVTKVSVKDRAKLMEGKLGFEKR